MESTALMAFERGLVRWVDLVRRWAVLVVAVTAVLTTAILYYTAGNLKVNTDTADMLSRELPFRQRYLEFQAAFPQFSNQITIVVEAGTADRADEAARRLAARLREAPHIVREVFDPEGEPFFARNGLLYMDLSELEDLADRLADAQGLLAALAEDPSLRGLFEVLELALKDVLDGNDAPADLGDVMARIARVVAARLDGEPQELSWQELLSGRDAGPADRRHFIQVKPRLDWSSLAPAAQAMDWIRDTARELGLDEAHGVQVRLTGGAAISTEELESVFEGTTLAAFLSLVLVAFLLLYGLRSLRLVIATLVTLIVGLIWSAGFAIAAVGSFNLISVAFAVLFIGLGVDFGIHFALRYREEMTNADTHEAALRRSAKGVGGALALCAAAAAIGFYSFVPTPYRGLAELGLISGTSMFIAFVASVTLLPALLTFMPLPDSIKPLPSMLPNSGRLLERHGGGIAAGAIALGIGASFLVPYARFDFNPLHLKDPNTESVRTALELMADENSTPSSISILAPDSRHAEELAQKLRRLEPVGQVVTLSDLIPERQDEKLDIIREVGLVLMPVFETGLQKASPSTIDNRLALDGLRRRLLTLLAADQVPAGIREGARRLEASLNRLAASTAEHPELFASVERGLLALLPGRLERLRLALQAEPVDLEDLPADLRARYVAADGRVRVEVSPAGDVSDNDELRRFVDSVRSVAPQATDSPVVVLEAGRAVVDAIRQAALTALVLVSMLLLVLLRSLRDLMLVFFPLALAGVLTVATAVLLDLPFNFANVIVLPLLMGLGVASGIHFVMRAREGRDGPGLLHTSTPRAVVFSALTTIGSFGSLAVSSHRGTASMGMLLTIAIGFTLLCTLVALPALMAWLARRRPSRTEG